MGEIAVMETERLVLRRFMETDVIGLWREVYSDAEVVWHYNGGRVFALEEVRELVLRRRNGGQWGYWTVLVKETGELIGQVHLDPYVNLEWYRVPEEADILCRTPEVHLGFAFGRRFWGQGYAAEACRELIRYAFCELRLARLLGGADIGNLRSVRLHERLGYRLHYYSEDVVAVLDNPLVGYRVREFEERDREAVNRLGTPVIDWWHREVDGASIHLVAEAAETGEIVGHLQGRDRGVPEPSHRSGQFHITLDVAVGHRRKGVGGVLYARVEAFARRRKARSIYAAYGETPGAPAASFLKRRGFVTLERFLPSACDLVMFDPALFDDAVARVERQGIVLTTYAEWGDSAEHRRQLYALEEAARALQPFRETEPYVVVLYDKWEEEFVKRELETVFLALGPDDGEAVGVVTGLEWYFTGTHPYWVGRGIATALKVRCMGEAKRRGISFMETENHEDNAAMLAINRKLGFVFSNPEVACIKHT